MGRDHLGELDVSGEQWRAGVKAWVKYVWEKY